MAKRWEVDNEWALSMQNYAIQQYYKVIWPSATIVELDNDRRDELKRALDIGGADKMIHFADGRVAFLGQRFRRWGMRVYDDFTLRYARPSGNKTEYQKIYDAISGSGFIASYYAVGHVNKDNNGFIRFRVLLYRELMGMLVNRRLIPQIRHNKDNSSSFMVISFADIPRELFIWDTFTE